MRRAEGRAASMQVGRKALCVRAKVFFCRILGNAQARNS